MPPIIRRPKTAGGTQRRSPGSAPQRPQTARAVAPLYKRRHAGARIVEAWAASFEQELPSFKSLSLCAESELVELLHSHPRYDEAHDGAAPPPLRPSRALAAVCLDLLSRIVAIVARFAPLLALVRRGLLASVYAPSHLAEAVDRQTARRRPRFLSATEAPLPEGFVAVPPAEVVPRPLPAFASPAAVPLFRRTPWFVLAERLRALCSEQHVMLVELESEAALRRALQGNVVSSLLSGRNARFIQRSTFRAWALHVKYHRLGLRLLRERRLRAWVSLWRRYVAARRKALWLKATNDAFEMEQELARAAKQGGVVGAAGVGGGGVYANVGGSTTVVTGSADNGPDNVERRVREREMHERRVLEQKAGALEAELRAAYRVMLAKGIANSLPGYDVDGVRSAGAGRDGLDFNLDRGIGGTGGTGSTGGRGGLGGTGTGGGGPGTGGRRLVLIQLLLRRVADATTEDEADAVLATVARCDEVACQTPRAWVGDGNAGELSELRIGASSRVRAGGRSRPGGKRKHARGRHLKTLASAKPLPIHLANALIPYIYSSKLVQDELDDEAGRPHEAVTKFAVHALVRRYGIRVMAVKYARGLIELVRTQWQKHPRLEAFGLVVSCAMKGQRSEIACDAVGATAENDADDEDEDYYVEGVVDPNQPLVVKAVFEYLADVFYVPVKDGRPNVGDKPPPSPGAHLDTVYGTTEGLGLKATRVQRAARIAFASLRSRDPERFEKLHVAIVNIPDYAGMPGRGRHVSTDLALLEVARFARANRNHLSPGLPPTAAGSMVAMGKIRSVVLHFVLRWKADRDRQGRLWRAVFERAHASRPPESPVLYGEFRAAVADARAWPVLNDRAMTEAFVEWDRLRQRMQQKGDAGEILAASLRDRIATSPEPPPDGSRSPVLFGGPAHSPPRGSRLPMTAMAKRRWRKLATVMRAESAFLASEEFGFSTGLALEQGRLQPSVHVSALALAEVMVGRHVRLR